MSGIRLTLGHQQLSDRRSARGWSLGECARQCHVTVGVFSRICAGKALPGRSLSTKLRDLLGIDPSAWEELLPVELAGPVEASATAEATAPAASLSVGDEQPHQGPQTAAEERNDQVQDVVRAGSGGKHVALAGGAKSLDLVGHEVSSVGEPSCPKSVLPMCNKWGDMSRTPRVTRASLLLAAYLDPHGSQKKLSNITGIGQSRLSRLGTGALFPRADEATVIERHTGIPTPFWAEPPPAESDAVAGTEDPSNAA